MSTDDFNQYESDTDLRMRTSAALLRIGIEDDMYNELVQLLDFQGSFVSFISSKLSERQKHICRLLISPHTATIYKLLKMRLDEDVG